MRVLSLIKDVRNYSMFTWQWNYSINEGGDFDNEETEDNFRNYVLKWTEKLESRVKAEIWDQKKQRLLNHSKKKKDRIFWCQKSRNNKIKTTNRLVFSRSLLCI